MSPPPENLYHIGSRVAGYESLPTGRVRCAMIRAVANTYRVLGEISVEGGDGTVFFPTGRQAQALALLVAMSPESVRSGRMIEEMWGDDTPASPESALHSVISRLRASAKGDVVSAAGSYRILSQEIDAVQFEAAVERARGELSLSAYRDALNCWTGEPFPGLDDLPSVALAAERLRQLRRRAQLEYWVLLVENGHPGEAAAQLGVEVAADPFDEEILGLYMRALAASGRRREALSAFRRYSEILAEESGLEPSAAIKELELGILVDDGVVEPSSKRAVLDMSVRYVDLGDEITVAVGRTGVGRPLVVHPGWLSKLDLTAAGLDFRSRFWARLAESFELVLFDRFGTGLSTGNPETSLRAGVEELKRVIRTLGGPVPVLGASAGGPIAVLAAAEAPELFSHLILYGTYASGPAIFSKAVADSMVSMVASSWGMGSDVLSTLIDPEGSSQTRQEYAEFQKTSATPEVASGYLRQLYEADVSGHLRELETPTLVIHYSGDKAIPARGGDQLARGIPGSTYLPLEGTTHYPLLQDFDRVAGAIEEFVTEG